MHVEQLSPGLWRWTAPHPDWRPEHAEGSAGWERDVSCCAVVADDAFVLALEPLLEPPVELVLPAHGEPVRDGAGAALRRALDA